MDLLNEKKEETKFAKNKKFVLVLIIVLILLTIGIIILMVYLSSNKEVELEVYINGNTEKFESNAIKVEGDLIIDANGIRYVSVSDICNILDIKFDNSDYFNYGGGTMKCYVKNGNLISNLELDSNIVSKYEEGTNIDLQYYSIKHNILSYNDKLYIAIEDIQKALNILCIVQNQNRIDFYSTKYLQEKYTESLKEIGYDVTTEENNLKALAYGWIIASKNDLWGVLDTSGNEIISCRFASIYFDECNFNYIVSSPNEKYGIITTDGRIDAIELKYDGLEIINYENNLYKVKYNDKYGIMKKDGTMLTEIVYDSIGYEEDKENKILYTLIIPPLNDDRDIVDIPKTILVKKDGKYGLIALSNGEEILPCDHLDKIYSINEVGTIQYMVEVEKQTLKLLEYLVLRDTQIVHM